MAVLLTISETLDGAAVADALAGGGTGVDIGSVVNNAYAPIILKSANTGAQALFISHDATIDPITDVKTFMQTYGVGTGFTYGGANTAAADFTSLKNLANASGSSKNNADGLSGGVWIDMDWDASTTNQFDQASFPTVVKIYGDGLTDGISLASAFTLKAAAMVYNAPGETSASAPVDGQIGKAASTTLGDAAHVKLRLYIPNSYSSGGIIQWEWVIAYSFTSALCAAIAPTLFNLVVSKLSWFL
jgi:hypothetical protein